MLFDVSSLTQTADERMKAIAIPDDVRKKWFAIIEVLMFEW